MLTSLSPVTTASAEESVEAERSRFVGDWVRNDSELDDEARARLIEEVSEAAPFMIRALARTVMRRRMVATERYSIRATDRGLLIAFDDDEPVLYLIDAEPVDDKKVKILTREPDGSFKRSWRYDETTHGHTVWQVRDGDEPELVITALSYNSLLRDADGEPIPVRTQSSYSALPDAPLMRAAE